MRHNREFIYFLGLILCNLIWAFNPVVGKTLLANHSPLQVVWLRYLSSIITLLVVGGILGKGLSSVLQVPKRNQVGSVLVIALLTFWLGPLLQIIGLSMSHATLNAIIIAMEPLMTVVVAWFVLGEKVMRAHMAFFSMSVMGFVLLSGLTRGILTVGEWNAPFVIGNLLMLASLAGEACYSSFGRKLFAAGKDTPFTPATAMATPLLIGVGMMSAMLALPLPGAGLPTELGTADWLGVLWLGPLSTAGGYLFWNFALKRLSIASMALTLFVQPLAGALFGVSFLGETLDFVQIAGGILIFVSVTSQQVWELRRTPQEIKT